MPTKEVAQVKQKGKQAEKRKRKHQSEGMASRQIKDTEDIAHNFLKLKIETNDVMQDNKQYRI